MWRRASNQLERLAPWRQLNRSVAISGHISTAVITRSHTSASSSQHSNLFQQNPNLFSHRSASDSDIILKGKKRVEDVMPIATGHEREELEAKPEGRSIMEMDNPFGPFGSKNGKWDYFMEQTDVHYQIAWVSSAEFVIV